MATRQESYKGKYSVRDNLKELNRLKEEALGARRVFKKMVQEAIRESEKMKVDKLITEGEEKKGLIF